MSKLHIIVGSALGNRTPDSAVRGRRLNLLTNAPYSLCASGIIAEYKGFVYCFPVFFVTIFFTGGSVCGGLLFFIHKKTAR